MFSEGKSFYLDKLYLTAPLHRTGNWEALPVGEAPMWAHQLSCASHLAGLSYLLQVRAKSKAGIWQFTSHMERLHLFQQACFFKGANCSEQWRQNEIDTVETLLSFAFALQCA